MSDYKVIKKGKREESFGAKAQLLQLSAAEQVQMLNTMYKGDVTFGLTASSHSWMQTEEGNTIQVIGYKPNVISIDLPDLENYNMDDLVTYSMGSQPLSSIKLPKCIAEVDLSKAWCQRINRIFVWDTTRIEYGRSGRTFGGNGLEMVIIQSTSGKKPQLIRYRK